MFPIWRLNKKWTQKFLKIMEGKQTTYIWWPNWWRTKFWVGKVEGWNQGLWNEPCQLSMVVSFLWLAYHSTVQSSKCIFNTITHNSREENWMPKCQILLLLYACDRVIARSWVLVYSWRYGQKVNLCACKCKCPVVVFCFENWIK